MTGNPNIYIVSHPESLRVRRGIKSNNNNNNNDDDGEDEDDTIHSAIFYCKTTG